LELEYETSFDYLSLCFLWQKSQYTEFDSKKHIPVIR